MAPFFVRHWHRNTHPTPNGYPPDSVSISKSHVHCVSGCPGRRLSTWQIIAASCPTALGDLQSAHVPPFMVSRTFSSHGERTFAAAGPRLWNSLPAQLCNPDIIHGRQLKGHFLQEAWTWRSVTSDTWCLRKTLTYLVKFVFWGCLSNSISHDGWRAWLMLTVNCKQCLCFTEHKRTIHVLFLWQKLYVSSMH